MSQGTEHHVEEAEHAAHAAHNPFDRKVALSMAIVAAAWPASPYLAIALTMKYGPEDRRER